MCLSRPRSTVPPDPRDVVVNAGQDFAVELQACACFQAGRLDMTGTGAASIHPVTCTMVNFRSGYAKEA